MNIFIIIFLFFSIKNIYTFSASELLDNVYLYSNELCSYNGIPKINSTTNEVTCECKERYANEPRKDKIKYINGHMIQCSYERKSRFYTLFLALCLPFGFDFLYLNQYISFFISLSISLFTISINIIVFFMNYKINVKSKETKLQVKLNRIVEKVNDNKNNEENKCFKVINKISSIMTLTHSLFIITCLVLHLSGKLPDGNNVYTENDLGYLFTTPE